MHTCDLPIYVRSAFLLSYYFFHFCLCGERVYPHDCFHIFYSTKLESYKSVRFGAQGQFTMHRGQRQYFHPRWGGMRNKLKVLQKICLGHFFKTPRGIQSKKKNSKYQDRVRDSGQIPGRCLYNE